MPVHAVLEKSGSGMVDLSVGIVASRFYEFSKLAQNVQPWKPVAIDSCTPTPICMAMCRQFLEASFE